MNSVDRSALRERLKRLLSARSIVFVGGAQTARAIEYCDILGFQGEVWSVHPTRASISGRPCFRSISALPHAPDAAFVATSQVVAVEVMRELAAIGTAGAVCYSAGFAEVGGAGIDLQRELVEAAGGLAVVGPNVTGVVNFLDAVPIMIASHGALRPERGVAVISQSGTVTINAIGADRSLPIAYLLSIGNQAVLEMPDYMEVMLDDPRVSAIGVHIEGLKDVHAFARAAHRALRQGVPVVALKTGTSVRGSEVVTSHTASLAGADELYRALFERLGVIRAGTFGEWLETLKLITVAGAPAGNRVAVITCSGADACQTADLAEKNGLDLMEPQGEARERLRAVLPAIAPLRNPLDYTMAYWGDLDAQLTLFKELLGNDYDLSVLIGNYPCAKGYSHAGYELATEAFILASQATGRRSAFVSNLPEGLPVRERGRLIAAGIAPLQGLDDSFAAMAKAIRWRQRREAVGARELELFPVSNHVDRRILDEWRAKDWVEETGIRVPVRRRVKRDAAARAAEEIGYPVVVKRMAEGIAHKSELGLVVVDVRDEAQLAQVLARMAGEGDADFLVEAMVGDAVAEALVGVRCDPLFGAHLVLGTGGIHTELLRDIVNVILPTDEGEIRAALQTLKLARLLSGYRGKPAGDCDALIAAILTLTERFARDAGEVLEVEINPLLVRPEGKGVIAVDAVLVLRQSG